MIKKIFSSKRGEGYIDIAVGVIVLAMFLVLVLNVFSAITLRTNMDRISSDLLEVATYTGAFGTEFDQRVEALKAQYFDFEVTTYAPTYYSEADKKVQLGDLMTVTITVQFSLGGIDTSIPLDLSVHRSGKSENYWK